MKLYINYLENTLPKKEKSISVSDGKLRNLVRLSTLLIMR